MNELKKIAYLCVLMTLGLYHSFAQLDSSSEGIKINNEYDYLTLV